MSFRVADVVVTRDVDVTKNVKSCLAWQVQYFFTRRVQFFVAGGVLGKGIAWQTQQNVWM